MVVTHTCSSRSQCALCRRQLNSSDSHLDHLRLCDSAAQSHSFILPFLFLVRLRAFLRSCLSLSHCRLSILEWRVLCAPPTPSAQHRPAPHRNPPPPRSSLTATRKHLTAVGVAEEHSSRAREKNSHNSVGPSRLLSHHSENAEFDLSLGANTLGPVSRFRSCSSNPLLPAATPPRQPISRRNRPLECRQVP